MAWALLFTGHCTTESVELDTGADSTEASVLCKCVDAELSQCLNAELQHRCNDETTVSGIVAADFRVYSGAAMVSSPNDHLFLMVRW